MKQPERLTKRDLMAEKLFWPLYETPRTKCIYSRKGRDKAIDMAVGDAYGIVDAMLALLKKERK